MKVLEKYYNKIYAHTNRLLKKVFGLDVVSSLREMYCLRKEIEKEIDKPIEMITEGDLVKYNLSHRYCKYKTLSNILSVLSGASFLNSFCVEDLENMKM